MTHRTDSIARADRPTPVEVDVKLQSEILTHLGKGVVLTRVADARIVHANPKFNEMFGYGAGELVGQHIAIVNAPAEKSPEEIATIIMDELHASGTWSGELANRRKDGSIFWCRATVSTFHHSLFGEVWVSVHADITEEKQAQAALKASEEQYRQLFQRAREEREMFQTVIDYAPCGILVSNEKGEFLIANKATTTMLGGMPTGDVDGPSHRYSLHQANGEDFPSPQLPLVRALRGEASHEVELMIRRGDGSEVVALVSGTPVRRESGKLWAAVATMQDVTARKAAEEDLKKAREALQEHAAVLEAKVLARTSELRETNQRLQAEIRERISIEENRAALLRKLAKAEEEQRRRIARELHDQMGQHVTALLLGLRSLKEAATALPEIAAQIPVLERQTSQIGLEIHRLALDLRPTALDDLGLLPTVKNYVFSWGKRAQINVDFQSASYPEKGTDPEIESTFYRIVQEALNNIARHAKATRVSVILEFTTRQVQLIVEDDGCGFDPELALRSANHAGKLGLLGMRERLANLSGSLQIESAAGAGTTLFARIPLGADEFCSKNSDSAG